MNTYRMSTTITKYSRKRDTCMGPLMGGGGPNVACKFKEMAMLHVVVTYFAQRHMSNLRKGYVTCHYNV